MLSLPAFISLVVLCSTLCTVACETVENNASGGLRPRNSAPQFKAKSVIDDKFKDVSLADYSALGNWVVLVKCCNFHSTIIIITACSVADGMIGTAKLTKPTLI